MGNLVRVKSSGMARGLANARPPGSAKFANAPLPGLTRRKMPRSCPGGGGWAQVELTGALRWLQMQMSTGLQSLLAGLSSS